MASRVRAAATALAITLCLSTAVDAQTGNPRELVALANRALSQGRYYEAIELYFDAQAANPSYFEALYGLARAYYQLEEYDEALGYLARAEGFTRNNAALRNLRGQLLVAVGRLEDARAVFSSVIEAEPNNLEARLGTAELELARGRNEAAVATLEDTLRIYPENRKALLSLVLVYDFRGRPEISQRYLEQALRYHRTDPAVHVLAAEHYLTVESIDDARLHAMTALSLSPNNMEALRLLSRAELAAGRPQAALSIAEQLIGLDPSSVEGFYLAGRAHARLEEYGDAIRSLGRALRLEPTDELIRLSAESLLLSHYPIDDDGRAAFADYHYRRGLELRLANLVDDAADSYRRALLLNPFHVDARLERAEIYRLSGFAARYLQELEVVASLGDVDEKTGDAIEVYRSVLADSVAADWAVDQFDVQRDRYTLALFVDGSRTGLSLPGFDEAVAEFVRFLLVGYENLETAEDVRLVGSVSDAFSAAREEGADFYAVLSFEDGERSFAMTARVYLARTGSLVREFRSFTAGNDMVGNATARVVRSIHDALPFRARLVERDVDRGLISAGRIDGVEADDVLHILPQRAVLLAPRSFTLEYPDQEVLGEFVVTRVDDLVAEGRIQGTGLFDTVNSGDLLVVAPDEEERTATPSPTVFYPPLYNRVRELRN